MKRYLFVAWLFLKNSTMSYMEYRVEFAAWAIISILWISMTLISIEFIFGHISSIAGWTKDEVLLTVTSYGIFSSLLWIFILPSLLDFSSRVHKGDLDFILLKPLNARFLVSAHKFDLDNFPRVVILSALFVSLVGKLPVFADPTTITAFITVTILSIIIFYNLFFTLAISSIWLVDVFNLEDLFSNIMNAGRIPTFAFGDKLEFFFIYIVPVAFIATFPVQILLTGNFVLIIFLAAFLTIISFLISQIVWGRALRSYSSASS